MLGKWKSDPEYVSGTGLPPKVNKLFPLGCKFGTLNRTFTSIGRPNHNNKNIGWLLWKQSC